MKCRACHSQRVEDDYGRRLENEESDPCSACEDWLEEQFLD